jgi:hypothetical protein
MVFFVEIHVFLHLSQISLFGANRPYLQLETLNLQEVFLSKTNSVFTGKQCVRSSGF